MLRRILVLLVVLAACSEGEVPSPQGAGTGSEERPAKFERRLWLLAGDPDSPIIAVFDFDIVQHGPSLWHGSRALLQREAAWAAVLDTVWQTDAVREPWRLLPHGSLRLLLDDTGELEALVHGRSDQEIRLSPGPILGHWHEPGGVQQRLQRAVLDQASGAHSGILLDARAGERTAGGGPGPLTDSARHVFVSDGAGHHLVLTDVATGEPQAWLHRHGEDLPLGEATVHVMPAARPDAGDVGPGTTWVIDVRNGSIRAELRSQHVLHATSIVLDGDSVTYHALDGWLLTGSERRPVFGVLREASR